jgi:hypothetical protein
VHVNDTVVSVGLTGNEEPTPGLLEAMHAQSQALVSSARLPDTPAPPPLRRSFVARFLLILLAPPAFFLGAMALFAGAGTWAAFALLVLGAGGTMWSALRRHPRR